MSMPPEHPILDRRRREEARIDSILMCLALIACFLLAFVCGCTGVDRARLDAGIDMTAAERALDKRYEGIKTMCLYELTREDATHANLGLDWIRCVRREMGI